MLGTRALGESPPPKNKEKGKSKNGPLTPKCKSFRTSCPSVVAVLFAYVTIPRLPTCSRAQQFPAFLVKNTEANEEKGCT